MAQAVIRRPLTAEGRLGSCPGQSLWDLWWTKWHWDWVFSEFGFPLSVSFRHGSPYTCVTWRMNNWPFVAAVQRQSHPINMNASLQST
jgi:hypothetical protein